MSFEPTFAHSFYRPCAAGNAYLANLALLGEPLTPERLRVIQPLMQAAGPLVDPSFNQLWQRTEDAFTSSPQDPRATYYQYQLGLVMAQTAPKMLVGLTDSVRRSLATSDEHEEVREVLSDHWDAPGNGQRRRPAVSDEALLWSMARNAGNIEAAARELGYRTPTLYVRLQRSFADHPDVDRLKRIHRMNERSVGDLKKYAAKDPEYTVLDESNLATQATLAIMMGSLLMAQAGVFDDETNRQVVVDAQKLSCDNCAVVFPPDYPLGYSVVNLFGILRSIIHNNASPKLAREDLRRHFAVGRAPRLFDNPLLAVPPFYNPTVAVPLILNVEP